MSEIVMYGADWCGDCLRAKRFFADNGVDYTYVDLEANPDEVERVLERNDGVKKIPVIVFGDDSHLVEPSNAELEAKLASITAAQPSTADESTHATTVTDAGHRFELRVDGELRSFADYTTRNETVVVPHVETMPEHRGNGLAEQLMDGVVEVLRDSGRTIVPVCPYAANYLRDRPATHDLLAQ